MILVINPGSTSSKISLFSNDAKLIVDSSLNHATEDINKCENVVDQKDFRIEAIEHFFSENKIDTGEIDVVIGRGGLMKFIEGGTYAVNDRLLEDVSIGVNGQHASNLGAVIANELANKFGVEAFIVDPPVVDELMDGGLGPGELGVVVAPSGVGKTWILTALGAAAVRAGLRSAV